MQNLAEGGAAVKSISVRLRASEDGEVKVEQVTAVVLNKASGPAAEAIIQAALGQDVNVTAAVPQQEGGGQ